MIYIRSVIDSRLDAVPRLRQIIYRPGLLAGRPLWIDDPAFHIDRHVHHIRIADPGGGEEALLRLATQLLALRLDRKHPLWQIWFVTGLADGQVAVVLKLHHVVADGMAALRLITSLLDQPDRPDPPPASQRVARPAPRWRELVRDRLRNAFTLREPRRAGGSRCWLESVLGQLQVLTRSWNAPRTSLNAPVGPHRQLAVLRIGLAEAKRVAHHHDSKVNDVILDLAAGGLRGLLRSRGEAIDGIRLHAAVAVSLRPPAHSADSGNRTGGIVVGLPMGEADPPRRLRLIAAQSADAKQHQLNTTGNRLLIILAKVGLLQRFSQHQHLTNVIESNIVGPPATIRLLDTPVLDLVPIGNLAGNLAIAFLALSYAGNLTVTVQADADLFPDLPVLLTAMEQEWAGLLEACDAVVESRPR